MRHLAGYEDFSRESEIEGSSNRSFGIVFTVVFTIVGIGPLLTGSGVRVVRTDLAHVAATAAVVNLSSNDTDTVQFQRNLTELVLELRSRNLRTVLMLEPNSIEQRWTDSPQSDLSVKHALVRAVATRYGLAVIDLHEYLAERKDAGFVWWDYVHLTSFGQRLVADQEHDGYEKL
jgi:lysophospholipase L1-like esterase